MLTGPTRREERAHLNNRIDPWTDPWTRRTDLNGAVMVLAFRVIPRIPRDLETSRDEYARRSGFRGGQEDSRVALRNLQETKRRPAGIATAGLPARFGYNGDIQ